MSDNEEDMVYMAVVLVLCSIGQRQELPSEKQVLKGILGIRGAAKGATQQRANCYGRQDDLGGYVTWMDDDSIPKN